MATLTELERQNPNIRRQYDEWRQQRQQRGEDANDYNAFRQHVMQLGAPDPGTQAFDEFSSTERSGQFSGAGSGSRSS